MEQKILNRKIANGVSYIAKSFKQIETILLPMMGIGFIVFIMFFIPIIIPILQLPIHFALPIILLGISIYTFHFQKERVASFETFFKGFSHTLPIIFSILIQYFLIIVLAVIMFYIFDLAPLIKQIDFTIFNQSNPNPQDLKDLIEPLKLFIWPVILLSILFLFITLIFIFVPHIIYFYNIKTISAIEGSFKMVQKNFLALFLYFLVISIIMIISAIPMGLGLIFTIPLFEIGKFLMFKDITGLE